MKSATLFLTLGSNLVIEAVVCRGLYWLHSVLIGYLLWIFGFTGAHRFYYGKPISRERPSPPEA